MVPPFGPFVPRFLRWRSCLFFDFWEPRLLPREWNHLLQFPFHFAFIISHPGTAASLFLPLGIIRMIQDDDILIDIDWLMLMKDYIMIYISYSTVAKPVDGWHVLKLHESWIKYRAQWICSEDCRFVLSREVENLQGGCLHPKSTVSLKPYIYVYIYISYIFKVSTNNLLYGQLLNLASFKPLRCKFSTSCN